MDPTIILGVGMFVFIILSLVLVLMVARSYLVASGEVTITIISSGGGPAATTPANGFIAVQ